MHAKFIILTSAVALMTDDVFAFQLRGSKKHWLSERDYNDSIYSRSFDDFDLGLRDVDDDDLYARSFDEYELESRTFDDYYDLEARSADEDSDLFARGGMSSKHSKTLTITRCEGCGAQKAAVEARMQKLWKADKKNHRWTNARIIVSGGVAFQYYLYNGDYSVASIAQGGGGAFRL